MSAYIGTQIYETFGSIRERKFHMQEFYYGAMIVIGVARLVYDIAKDTKKKRNK